MSLGEVLVDLSKLLEDPEKNADAIYAILDKNQELAEYEVARFYVAQAMAGDLEAQLRSIDPRERLKGVKKIPLVCPANMAAKLVRKVFKDPDPKTRRHARHLARKLRLRDVALPDTRSDPGPPQYQGPYTAGAFNPTGWAFGVYDRTQTGQLRADRLQRNKLPSLTKKADLLKLLGLKKADDLSVLLRPGIEPGSAYVEFVVPKATGGERRIAAPRKPLRAAQRKILAEILAKVPTHKAAHGFIEKRSTVTNAKEHKGAAIVVKMDLVDFFPSIHYRRVIGLFEELGYPTDVATSLAGVCTYRPKLEDGTMVWPGLLPQGAPTSPAITNLICRRLDARLSALAKKAGAKYTRYADDLTFSFQQEPEKPKGLGRFLWWVDQICQQEGFSENTKKRRVFRKSSQQRVTGIVVNDGLTVPRKLRRRFRAMVHNVKKNGVEQEARRSPRGKDNFEAYLHGFAAYVNMVQPKLGAKLAKDVDDALANAPAPAAAKKP
jgi:RNA-directed DNA polymerase